VSLTTVKVIMLLGGASTTGWGDSSLRKSSIQKDKVMLFSVFVASLIANTNSDLVIVSRANEPIL